MENCYICSYCGTTVSMSYNTYKRYYADSMDCTEVRDYNEKDAKIRNDTLNITFHICPICNETSVMLKGMGKIYQNKTFLIRPSSLAIKFPEYVPEKIRQDYEEACAIVNLSPKSSATLSRRCLQAMISDFWNIKKNRLVDAIKELENRVSATQWKVINAIRTLGNIGAHPEADINTIIDINPEDAQKLITVIELLIKQWYIERHEQEQLFQDVLQLNNEKQSERKSKS